MSSSILKRVDHRPWPLPNASWVMAMRWSDLLFAHWPVPVDRLRPLIPAELEVESFDGTGWVGVVPLTMSNVHARWLPSMPAFPELNLRTYVRHRDRPGVWFFSLDAHSQLAVTTARTFFHLPYFKARMSSEARGESIRYSSRRTQGRAARAEFKSSYSPRGDVIANKTGSLEYFLTERYCLYTVDRQRRIRRGDIHHHPWALQPADIQIEVNTIANASGIQLPNSEPLCHFSRRLDVVAWPTKLV